MVVITDDLCVLLNWRPPERSAGTGANERSPCPRLQLADWPWLILLSKNQWRLRWPLVLTEYRSGDEEIKDEEKADIFEGYHIFDLPSIYKLWQIHIYLPQKVVLLSV